MLAVIWALLGYFGFFDLGFGKAVTQRMASLPDADDSERSKLLWTALLSTFALGVLASVLLWLFSDYILLKVIDMSDRSRSEASGAVALDAACPTGLVANDSLDGRASARLRFAETNTIQLFGNLISQLLPLAVAASGHVELKILVPAALSSRLLVAALLFQQSRQHVPLTGRPVINVVHLKAMLSYGGWVSVMTVLGPLLVTIDRFLIAALSGAKAVTAYTVPYDLVSRAMVIPGSLSSALFPRLALASPAAASALAERATAALVAVMTPIVIVGTFAAQPFLNVWLGKSFAAASAGVSELILLGVWVNALVFPHHARLMAKGKPRTVVMVYLIQIPIYLLMLWMGLKYWGVFGAAGAWSLRVLIDTSLLLYVNRALLKTLRLAAPYAALVTAACSGVLLLHLEPLAYWSFGGLLLGLALLRDRELLAHLIKSLMLRKVAAQ